MAGLGEEAKVFSLGWMEKRSKLFSVYKDETKFFMPKQQRKENTAAVENSKIFLSFFLASIVVHCVESEEYKLPFSFRFRFYLHMKSRSFCSHIIVRSLLLAPIHYTLCSLCMLQGNSIYTIMTMIFADFSHVLIELFSKLELLCELLLHSLSSNRSTFHRRKIHANLSNFLCCSALHLGIDVGERGADWLG